MRELVIPGETLVKKNVKAGYGTYVKGDNVCSSVFGILSKSPDFVKVVPLQGKYMPYEGDYIIGVVRFLRFRGCFMDINSPYGGYLPLMEEGELGLGDVVMAKVEDIDDRHKATLCEHRHLYDGKLIDVSPVKIPRIVGRKGSMLETLKNGTNCNIFVGRNGLIYIKGDRDGIRKVENAIKLIAKEAHTSGLTERVKKMLEK